MPNEISNVTTLLAKDGVTVGEITNLEPPEIINESVESTNVGSNGWREFISGGLREVGEMTLTLNYVLTVASGLENAAVNGTRHAWVITYPNTKTHTFSGYVTSFQPGAVDYLAPESLSATVKIRPTGPLS